MSCISCIRSPVVRRRRPSPRKERSPLHIRQVMIGSSDILRTHRMSLTGKKQDWRCRPPPRASRRYPVGTGLLAIPPTAASSTQLAVSRVPAASPSSVCVKQSPAIFTHCCACRSRSRRLPIRAALGPDRVDYSDHDCTRSEGFQAIMHRKKR